MKFSRLSSILGLVLVATAGCDDGHYPFRTSWHSETLASGSKIQVTSFNLVWGAEHDEHALGKDCFAIEYVALHPDADAKARQAEAAEVFELVRPVSEQWGFGEATVAAIPQLEHRGPTMSTGSGERPTATGHPPRSSSAANGSRTRCPERASSRRRFRTKRHRRLERAPPTRGFDREAARVDSARMSDGRKGQGQGGPNRSSLASDALGCP